MKLFRKLIKNNFLITVLLKVLENSPPIRLAKMKKNDHSRCAGCSVKTCEESGMCFHVHGFCISYTWVLLKYGPLDQGKEFFTDATNSIE